MSGWGDDEDIKVEKEVDIDVYFDLDSDVDIDLDKDVDVDVNVDSNADIKDNVAQATFSATAIGENTLAEADVHVLATDNLSEVDGYLLAAVDDC